MVTPEELKGQIQSAGEELGQQMDSALEFKPSRIARLLRAVQFSERVLIPHQDEEGAFTRAWLERSAAKSAQDSQIELLTDTVRINSNLSSQSCQMAKDPKVAAIYDPRKGLELDQELGAPQEDTLARIQELGSWVSAIADAELQKELKNAVPVHHLNFQGSNA